MPRYRPSPLPEPAEPRKPWERAKGESARSYAKFALYRDLGPNRSMSKIAEAAGVSLARLGDLSVEWRWVERAEAWDAEQESTRLAATLETQRERAIELANRRAQVRVDEVELGDALLGKARQMLEWPLELQTQRVEGEGEDMVVINEIHPVRWSMADAIRYVIAATTLKRRALGMETAIKSEVVDIEDDLRRIAAEHGLDPDEVVRLANEYTREISQGARA